MGNRYLPAVERFWNQVNKTDTCWLWVGGGRSGPYGAIAVDGKKERTHIFSWKLHTGKDPKPLWVLHKCDNPLCVRPSHLFLGTRMDNTKDMLQKGRSTRGIKQHSCKLTWENVHLIRRSKEGRVALAREFNVTPQHIDRIRRGDRWRYEHAWENRT